MRSYKERSKLDTKKEYKTYTPKDFDRLSGEQLDYRGEQLDDAYDQGQKRFSIIRV
jgi:hypothetical protein